MADLALEPALSGDVWLYDIDRAAAAKNEAIGNSLEERNTPGKWRYHTADTLKEALTGADFTIVSILPGTLDEMETDVHLPEKYGIYQSVGDTVGPGGLRARCEPCRCTGTLRRQSADGRRIRG